MQRERGTGDSVGTIRSRQRVVGLSQGQLVDVLDDSGTNNRAANVDSDNHLVGGEEGEAQCSSDGRVVGGEGLQGEE